MSRTDFEIAYDGDAVADGSMDVYEFAPALLATGKLVRRANHIINGDASAVQVKVRTAPPPGSFPVELHLYLDASTQLSMMGAPDAYQLLTAIGLVEIGKHAGAINNLFSLFKRLRGKKVEVVRGDSNVDSVTLNIDGDHATVHNTVINMYNDRETRKHFGAMLEPLTKPGVDEFQVRKKGEILSRVSKSEAEDIINASKSRENDDELDHGTFTKWMYATPKWKEGHQWGFSNDEGTTFSAKIKDNAFWERVHSDEISFTEHTRLRVQVEWFQERDNTGRIKTQHVVTRVLDIRAADHDRQRHLLAPPPEEG